MNLYDLKTPLTKMSYEEVVLFVRELRFQRTQDHSPPKKEKVKKQKDLSLLFEALDLSQEQKEMLLSLYEEKQNGN